MLMVALLVLLLASFTYMSRSKGIVFRATSIDGSSLRLTRFRWGFPVRLDFRITDGTYTLIMVKTAVPAIGKEVTYPMIVPVEDGSSIYIIAIPPSWLRHSFFRQGKDFDLQLSLYLKEQRGGKQNYIVIKRTFRVKGGEG